MFYQSTNENQTENSLTSYKGTRGKRNKNKKAAKRKNKNKDSVLKRRFALSMTSWAENFTRAATWQLKHQLVYWKSKAKSLEYENKILHDIIRKNCIGSTSGVNPEPHFLNEYHSETEKDSDSSGTEYDSASEPENMQEDNNEFAVSEEFISFLRSNEKYREDARREREKLRAKMAKEDIIEQMEAGPSEPIDTTKSLEQLYGLDYKKIGALEIALQAKYNEVCDKKNPVFWPNIPFNFN